MHTSSVTTLTAALLSGLLSSPAVHALPHLPYAPRADCVSGVHMIVARASTEAAGTGVIGGVANNVSAQISGSDILAVDYPATLSDYIASETAGVTAMTKLINDYASACPDSKIVLMGYSQGAQVAADVVCGASEANFPTTSAMSSDTASKIAAVVLMGDPTHRTGASFNKGTSTKDGVMPRQNTAGCDVLASRMASFCNSDDNFCDSGNSLDVHLSYVTTDGAAATEFIVNQFNAVKAK